MTPDEELSRWIAEKLGWKRGSVVAVFSYEGWYDPEGHFQVDDPDMVNDPAMTVTLIKHHKFVSLNCLDDEPCEYEATFCKSETHSVEGCNDFATAFAETPERAVAEAWAMANGWNPSINTPPTTEQPLR